MVVKEDGTKWACQSCLKGHRVSGCNHSDRELFLVPKKGRPVTQCQHCRLERKKRSAHVSCDCGAPSKPHHPKEKCIHLREAEERAKAGYHDKSAVVPDSAHMAAVAEEQGCCCHHGGKCTCAVKKHTGGNAAHGPAVKPRLEKMSTEEALTAFNNGHHRPVHRKHHTAHESGIPYRMPTPRSNPEQDGSSFGPRSVDSLALHNHMPHQPSAYIPQTSAPFNSNNTGNNGRRRRSKSEERSPKIRAFSPSCGGLGDSKLSGIDFSDLVPTQSSSSANSAMSDNYFPPLDLMPGIADNAFDPWSAIPSGESMSMPSNELFPPWPSSNESDSMLHPTLSNASSGTGSDIDEMPPMENMPGFPMSNMQDNMSDPNMPTMSSGMSPPSNRHSLPPGFFGNADFGFYGMGNEMPTSSGTPHVQLGSSPQNIPYDNTWQTPAMPSIQSVPQRTLGGAAFVQRPQSRSLGAGSAPNDDIRSLFPEIDLSNSSFGQAEDSQLNDMSQMSDMSQMNDLSLMNDMGHMNDMSIDTQMGGLPYSSGPTSAPANFDQIPDSGVTSQPWADGSMNMMQGQGFQSGNFPAPYNLDQNYSDSSFANGWPQ